MTCFNRVCVSRYILAGINTLIGITGLLLLSLGALFLNGDNVIGGYIAPIFSAVPGAHGSSVASIFTYFSVSIVIIGCFLLIVGVLGCCGALWAKKSVLYVYSGIVIFLILSEIVGVILCITLDDQVNNELRSSLKSTIEDSYAGSAATDPISKGWNYVFVTYECCGVDSYLDLHAATKWNRTGREIPDSCCKVKDGYPNYVVIDTACTTSPDQSNSNKSKSCFSSLQDLIHKYNSYLIGIGSGVLALEIILIVFACIVSRKRQKVDITKSK